MNLASLFNLAGPDLIIILLIVLLLFGAKNLPGLGRHMGRSTREFFKTEDESDEASERESQPQRGDRFAAINRVLIMVAVISLFVLLSVLSARH